MPEDIKKVLIIGSGPIIIGQSSEFDYSAVQACHVFKEDNIKVTAINSNPATILTDRDVADSVYIEPLNADTLKRIIAAEKPDAILPTMSGDTGYELVLELQQTGSLEENNISVLSINTDTIHKLKDPAGLKSFLSDINEPSVLSAVSDNIEDITLFANNAGLPITIQAAYEINNSNIITCHSIDSLKLSAIEMLRESFLHQIYAEKCVSGWKEIEYEVMRDCAGNCICVSNMENVDPVGIHAGDSIVVAPAQTLTDDENLKLRAASLHIISKLEICGNCGIQFALNPVSGDYAVISITPGISRSSAIVSKVTGYPIPRVAAKLALGYKIYEIKNDITGCTSVCNEPAIDYCAIKFPKWSFDSFDYADRRLGNDMQATGETISIGTSFELAFLKAVRSIKTGTASPRLPKLRNKTNEEVLATISESNDERIFAVYEAISRGISIDEIFSITFIDKWFLAKLYNIVQTEQALSHDIGEDLYHQAKKIGFMDETINNINSRAEKIKISPSYKMVDTCAAEFDAARPYFYSAYDDENESYMVSDYAKINKKKVLVIGSGPSSVGHASEFDYCNVHCVKALQKLGYTAIMANNNPCSVSTDFYVPDRLYIDPVSREDVENLISTEKPFAVITQFSGENSRYLTGIVEESDVRLLGINTELDAILTNPDKLKRRLLALKIPYTRETLFNATALELDVICDGEDCLIPGLAEHIEKSDIHSGDSISVYPSITIDEKVQDIIAGYACKIAVGFGIKGIINIQMVLYDNSIYITGISTKYLYNIPFMCKVTGLPIIEIAVRCMLGEKIKNMPYGSGVYPTNKYFAVRVPVFCFEKISGTDTQLGREMKSTGEVMGIADNFEDALLKGLTASGMQIKKSGGILMTVRNSDKQDAIMLAEKFSQLDFTLYATAGTAKTLNTNCVATNAVRKIHEGTPNVIDLINSKKIVYVVSTSEKAENAAGDDIKIRRLAIEKQIPTFTTLDTAKALVRCLAKKRTPEDIELVDITKI